MKLQMSLPKHAGHIVSLVLAVTATIFLSAVASQAALAIQVTNTNDSNAAGTLRSAINSSNSSPGFDTIVFNIPGTGVHTINLNSPLPEITDAVYLDGTSQHGYSGTPLIELNGSNAGVSNGLTISAGNSVVLGLVINRFNGSGIFLYVSGSNSITRCYLGTSPSGISDLGNSGSGIQIAPSSNNNHIGGTSAASRNVISGNSNRGISVASTGNIIRGNYIGTNAAGLSALPNVGSGIGIINASSNTIGGPTVGERNVISGNAGSGIVISGQSAPANANLVMGNLIGVNINGEDLGNSTHGIEIDRASNNIIGGPQFAQNVIEGNESVGIRITGAAGALSTGNVIQGNVIGEPNAPNGFYGIFIDNGSSNNHIGGVATGEGNLIFANLEGGIGVISGTGNEILGNAILQNVGPGIDLGAPGVTPNDDGDGDTGGNNLQNFPVFSSVTNGGTNTTFTGSLNSKANTAFRIEFFINSECDSSGYGEGYDHSEELSIPSLITNASGNANFSVTIPTGAIAGSFVTATATDSAGNTSEFSPCALVTAPGPGSFSLNFGAKTVAENVVFQDVIIQRTGGNTGAVTVNFTTANGTATSPDDFTGPVTTYIFANGETSKTVIVTIINDTVDEADETLNLVLSSPTNGATLGAPSTAVLTITDNDPPPALSISDLSVAEGNAGFSAFNFNVTLSAASGRTVTVDYATIAGGTATLGNDYQTTGATLTFAPGQTSKSLTVLVNGDTQDEPNETFFVQLSAPTNATLAKAQGTGTIINDDAVTPASLQFGAATYSVQEDLTAVNITVTRTGDSSGSVTVNYATSNGTADQKGDYQLVSGALSFAPGEVSKTFSVLINEDSFVEGTETVNLTLSNPTGGSLGAQSTAVLNITDDAPESVTNPNDEAQNFVYQQYHDLLNREPDPGGLAYWTAQLTQCGNDQNCSNTKRKDISAAFYIELEFQETGYFVYRLQQASFGTQPTYQQFMTDRSRVDAGNLEPSKQAFAAAWVQRAAFKAVYPDAFSADQFVNKLYDTAGLVGYPSERLQAIQDLLSNTRTRAQVLREVLETPAFKTREYNPAFVLMQYFGYLRRDADPGGYQFWLNVINNQVANDTSGYHAMVCGFVTSAEYQDRFSALHTHGNGECGP